MPLAQNQSLNLTTKYNQSTIEMNVKQLTKWLSDLPEEFQEAEIQSIVHGLPATAKRVIAYKNSDGDVGICVNSMGTHISGVFAAHVQFVSTLSAYGGVQGKKEEE